MEKIKNRMYYLDDCVVYMEKSNCEYYKLSKYDRFHNWYMATNINDETDTKPLTVSDLVGNYVCD